MAGPAFRICQLDLHMGCPTGRHLHRCFSPQCGSIGGSSVAVRGTLPDGVFALRWRVVVRQRATYQGPWIGKGFL